MAISLAESAKLSQNQLRRGVIEAIVEDAPLLQLLPFEEVAGNAYAYTRENALPGAAFRTVNAAYSESTGTFDQKIVPLAILGGDAAVDRYISQTRSNDIADQRAVQTRLKAKAVAREFQKAFITGVVGSNHFDGLNAFLASTDQEIAAATNGMSVVGSNDNDRHAFLDKLDETISRVPNAGIILCNAQILSKFRASARRLSIYDETKDDYGKIISTYNGIPVVNIGNDASGNAILPQTETQGSSNATSSVYVVNLSEENGVVGLTNGGVQVYDLGETDAKPQFVTRIEFYCAIAPLAANSAARLKGVLNS